MDARGPLLFEYRPLPLTPMTLALLLLLGVVASAAPFAGLPGSAALLWVLPALLVGLWAVLQRPSPTRIFRNGIEVSLPMWRRWLRARSYIPWREVRNVYPAAYEVSGAAMSPFASSAGTLIHTGLGLERTDGHRVVVRFTPGSIRTFRAESPGFVHALEAVREAFADLGRPLVTQVRSYSDDEIRAMHEEARRPLLGLAVIVFAFFLPPAIVAGILVALDWAGIPPDGPVIASVLALAATPPLLSMWATLGRSRRRNHLLAELAKFEERSRAGG